MIDGNRLFRLVLGFAVLAMPINEAAAKSIRCPADMPYAGPAPISVVLSDISRSAVERPSKDPKTLSASFADMYEKSKATSLTVALADQDGPIWEETRGLKNSETLHYWASVGKSFTAVIIMQLVENKRLSLNDKLSNWIKNVPNGDLITIGMLLDHTSGLYSANEDQGTDTKLQRPLSLQDNIDILNKHGSLFCPGQYWRYSNTGYLFLGEIAEQIYDQSLQEIIQVRIFDKIGLKDSRVLQVADDVSDIAKPQPSDDQKSDIRSPGPAGPIAATSSDMLRFWRAFLDGELVKPATRDQMLARLYPMFDKKSYYGLGIMAMQVPDLDGKPVIRIGHAGGMPGIKAFVMIDPVSRQYVSVALTGDGPASAVAYNMLRKWQEAPTP